MFIPCHAACACVKSLLLSAASRNRILRGVLETRQALRTVSCRLGAVRHIFLLLILTHSTCEDNCERGEVLRAPCPRRGESEWGGPIGQAGGVGKWRGGLGVVQEVQVLTSAMFDSRVERALCLP